MTNQQTPAFVLDESIYEGHELVGDFMVAGPCEFGGWDIEVTAEWTPGGQRLLEDAPQILAEALKLRAENERLRHLMHDFVEAYEEGEYKWGYMVERFRQALADTTPSDTQGDGRGDG